MGRSRGGRRRRSHSPGCTMERSPRQGWAIVALDLNIDTSTPSGEVMANVLASVAVFERRLIGQRTRDRLAIKRARGVQLAARP